MSLKWRIAAGYSLLLIVALTVMSGIIVWRFQQILVRSGADERERDDAADRAVRAADDDAVLH